MNSPSESRSGVKGQVLSVIKCIAFDADNTLYQTRFAAKDADMAAMKILANGDTNALYAEFKIIVDGVKNDPDPKIRHRLYSYGLLSKNHGLDLAGAMYGAFKNKLLEIIEVMQGIKEILVALQQKGIKLFVITEDNREMAEAKLKKLDLARYFSGIVSSDDTRIMKPSEKYYALLLKDFRPEEIMVVGDSYEKDLAIPEKLGTKTLLVEKPEDLGKVISG